MLTSQEKNAFVSIVQHFVAGSVDRNFTADEKVILVEMLPELGIPLLEVQRFCASCFSFQTANQIIGKIDKSRRIQLARKVFDAIKRVGISGVWGLIFYKTELFKDLSTDEIFPNDEEEILADSMRTCIDMRYRG